MFKKTRLILIWLAAFFPVCGLSAVAASSAEGTGFHCSLGVGGRFVAEAELQLSEDGSALHYELVVHNVEGITMAHLHLGKAGEIGTPVAWLYPPGPPPRLIPRVFDGLLAEGTITADDLIGAMRGRPLSQLIAEIRADNVYINLHTKAHPRGDICGPVFFKEE